MRDGLQSGANVCTETLHTPTLHLGARAPANAFTALSALLSSTKLIAAFSSSSATICSTNVAAMVVTRNI
jgi:hypothetical protein